MNSSITVIAGFTFREAVHNRLFILTLVGMICLLGITEFVGDLAITETRRIQAALAGAGMRVFTVCTVSLFVITSVVREFNDKGFEVILALPIPRWSYLMGKMLGFVLLSLVIGMAAAGLLLVYSDATAVLIWYLSLQCELAIIIALSLLCLLTFNNITVSFVVVMAFYLLARSMASIQLISASPILESHSFSQEFMNLLVDGIAYVLPELHTFTSSDWLVYGGDWAELAPVIAQTLIYVTLLLAAALFDLSRKEL